MSTLSERIVEAMDTAGVSIPQVAEACSVKYQAVRKWFIGESVSMDGKSLVAFCNLTHFEPEWIMNGIGPKHRSYAKNKSQALTLEAMEKLPPEDQYKIPSFVDLLAQPKKTGNGV